ncbi:hypothetical protein TB1_041977 [Malus domestica]
MYASRSLPTAMAAGLEALDFGESGLAIDFEGSRTPRFLNEANAEAKSTTKFLLLLLQTAKVSFRQQQKP